MKQPVIDKWAIIQHVIAIATWLVLGAFVGIASVFLSSMIPAVLLGVTLGVCGAIVHSAIRILGVDFSRVVIITLVCVISILVTTTYSHQLRDLRAVVVLAVYFFVFGALVFACVEKMAYK